MKKRPIKSLFIAAIVLSLTLLFIQPGLSGSKNVIADSGSQTDVQTFTLSFPDECNSITEIPVAECKALVTLYNSTDGGHWTNHTNWLATDHPCSWYGVSCADGSVSVLGEGSNNLTGTIPKDLANLTNLVALGLDSNNLTGSIPPELGTLTHLTGLTLDCNQLTGNIPPELGNLTNLQNFWLSFNSLSGSIPPELGNLTKVKEFSLRKNELTGEIPTELGNLTNVTWFWLDYNQLTGKVPTSLGNLTNATQFSLMGNQLSGGIPVELGALTKLSVLALGGNQFTGSIPTQLGNLTNLTQLDLGFNSLSGTIPAELGNLTNLTDLILKENQLTGSIPPELGNLTNLTSLLLSGNQFAGNIPLEIGNLTKLTQLDLSWNALNGQIPSEMQYLTGLEKLGLSGNQLSGSIPAFLGNFTNLTNLQLDDNQFSGSIPASLGALTNLTELNFFANQLTGSIPIAFGNLTKLTYLDFGDNQLSGGIPTELGNLHNLDTFLLFDNNFSGSLPMSLTNLSVITTFSYQNTKLCAPASSTFQAWYNAIKDHEGDTVCLIAATLVSPVNNSATSDTTPTFRWRAVSGAVKYRLTVSNSSNLASPIFDSSTLTTNSATMTTALAAGPYYWRVRVLDALGNWNTWSPIWKVIVDPNLPTAPVLVSPSNGISTNKTTPTFTWQATTNAVHYNLMVDDSSTFSSPVYNSSTLTATSKTLTSALPEKTYYWKVRAQDAAGNWGIWSAVRHFTIDITPPGRPVLLTPANGASINKSLPTFTWAASTGAGKYELMVDDTSTFASPVYDSASITGTSKTLTTALPQNTYYWRVRAQDAAGNWSTWSTIWRVVIDTTPPAKPVLKTPANGSSTVDTTPAFTWSVSTRASGYQLMIADTTTFTTPVFTSAKLTGTSYTLTTALKKGTFYWRVRACDAAGNWSAWSSVWKLTIK